MNAFTKLLTVAALTLNWTGASASVVVNPAVGGAFGIDWNDGLGPIDDIISSGGVSLGATDWTFISDLDTDMSLFVTDAFIPGDAFSLVIDGVAVAWQQSGISGAGYFFGLQNLHLTGGVQYTLSLDVSQDCCGGGLAFATFSPRVAVVPLPASAALLVMGLGGLAALRRRKTKD